METGRHGTKVFFKSLSIRQGDIPRMVKLSVEAGLWSESLRLRSGAQRSRLLDNAMGEKLSVHEQRSLAADTSRLFSYQILDLRLFVIRA